MAVDCPGHADHVQAEPAVETPVRPESRITAFSRALRAGDGDACREILKQTDEKTLPSALATAMVRDEIHRGVRERAATPSSFDVMRAEQARFARLMTVFVAAGQRQIDTVLAKTEERLKPLPEKAVADYEARLRARRLQHMGVKR